MCPVRKKIVCSLLVIETLSDTIWDLSHHSPSSYLQKKEEGKFGRDFITAASLKDTPGIQKLHTLLFHGRLVEESLRKVLYPG